MTLPRRFAASAWAARPHRSDARPRARAVGPVLLAGLLMLAVPQPWAGQPDAAEPGDGYVADVADLPLMDGLEEVAEAGMAFDKPSGRIVEAYAHGAVETAAVRRFYRRTLPQLGWRRLGPDRFAREDEELEIDYLGADGDLTVRYTLQPR
jgi:hypothetical protein